MTCGAGMHYITDKRNRALLTHSQPSAGKQMAKPKRKRGNAEYISSSFYLPKELNIDFDVALLELKRRGYQQDRSDILAGLLHQWLKDPQPIARLLT